jgi:arylsulfatase A-like enzyme
MFSGLMPLEAGVPRNGGSFRDGLIPQTTGHVLSAAGYDCAYGGKWHVPEISMPEGLGFRRIAPFGDDRLADVCGDYLRAPHERPFLLVASFDNPHNICEWARGERLPWGELGDPPPVESCPNLPPNFAVGAFEPEIVRVEQATSWIRYPSVIFSEDDWRRYRWAYYRLVEKVDAEIGRLLAALDDAGLRDDTLVLFTSDHGDGHGAHRWNQKSVLYEEVIRVPLVARWPGRWPAGAVDRHLVSNGLDLLPTLCDVAGAPAPEGLRGRSLRGLAEDHGGPWRDELAVETVFDGAESYHSEGRALLTERYKYIAYQFSRRREQLFDLVADPGEMVNLAVDARSANVLDEHRRRLARWIETTDSRDRFRFRVPGTERGV